MKWGKNQDKNLQNTIYTRIWMFRNGLDDQNISDTSEENVCWGNGERAIPGLLSLLCTIVYLDISFARQVYTFTIW